MGSFLRVAKKFNQDIRGVTAMEYGLIAASTAVVIIAALGTIGTKLSAIFTSISTAL